MRLLLKYRKGAKSFIDLKVYNNEILEIYKSVYIIRSILEDYGYCKYQAPHLLPGNRSK